MHTTAVQAGKRLGHEGGGQTVAPGHAPHQAAQQKRVIAGQLDVGDVVQVDFVLARGAFRHGGADRNVLRCAGCLHIHQEGVEPVQVVEAMQPRPFMHQVRSRNPRAVRFQSLFIVVQQVKFQFQSDHRRQTELIETSQHALQNLAAVIVVRGRTVMVHLHQALPGRAARPGHRRERAGHRQARIVRVAVSQSDLQTIRQQASAVEQHGARRHVSPGLKNLLHIRARRPHAAQDSVNVRQQQVEILDLRVPGEKRIELQLFCTRHELDPPQRPIYCNR